MKYVTNNLKSKELDNYTINACGVPSLVLMERAIIELAKAIMNRFDKTKKFLVVAGSGNNGADAIGVARILKNQGYDIKVTCPFDTLSSDLGTQKDIARNYGVIITNDFNRELILEADIVIEGIFGSGLDREVSGKYQEVIESLNQNARYIISVDIASGLSATNGKILGSSVTADLTLTIGTYKLGLFMNDGPKVSGEVIYLDIDLASSSFNGNLIEYLDYDLLKTSFTKRSNLTNKGSFSKVLMIGGSNSMPGALEMATTAAERTGVGTLTILTTNKVRDLLYPKMPYAMFLTDNDEVLGNKALDILNDNLSGFNLVTYGNGATRSSGTEAILVKLLKSDKRLILDADSLFFLGKHLDLLKRDSLTIITPHVRELSYITGLDTKEILDDPVKICHNLVKKYPNLIIVLKSSFTLVCSNKNRGILFKPNSALAKGGSGDILAGIITGFIAKNEDPYKSVTEAVILHSLIAKSDLASEVITPIELMANLDKVYQDLNRK